MCYQEPQALRIDFSLQEGLLLVEEKILYSTATKYSIILIQTAVSFIRRHMTLIGGKYIVIILIPEDAEASYKWVFWTRTSFRGLGLPVLTCGVEMVVV